MENVITNGFCELNEQEMMETDGGLQGFFDWICGATAAEKRAEEIYKQAQADVRNALKENRKTPVDISDENARYWGFDDPRNW